MSAATRERVLVNVGCGPRRSGSLPGYFDSWRQTRVDSDPYVQPDLLADLTDLSAIDDASVDAIWAAHCMEHLYEHQIRVALTEFRRILREDGFVCVIVPDLQNIAAYIAKDRMHEVLYQSAGGPVTSHDVVFGFGPAIAAGQTTMAHHCGFTPASLQRAFQRSRYAEVILRRRPATLEIAAVARASASGDAIERTALMTLLQL